MDSPIEKPKKIRNQKDYFKTHYYADEEYRKKHLEKLKQKDYKCECCDAMISKSNVANHNKTKKHQTNAELFELKKRTLNLKHI